MTRAISLILMVLFILIAAVQFNDPDPLRWIAVYAGVAVIAGLAALGRYWRPLIGIWLVLCLGWSLYLMPGVFELFMNHSAGDLFTGMSSDRPYVEEAREALGLLIGSAALVYFLVLAGRARRDQRGAGGGP